MLGRLACRSAGSLRTALGRRRIASSAAVAASRPAPHPSESFLSGTSAVYFEEMWRQWKADPSRVHASWDAYFRAVEAGNAPGLAFQAPPSLQGETKVPIAASGAAAAGAGRATALAGGPDPRILHLARAFQVRGHEMAQVDPLGFMEPSEAARNQLDPASYGISEADMDTRVDMAGFEGMKGFLGPEGGKPTVRELIERLQRTYCGPIGFEYMHILDREKCNWLRERVELANAPQFSKERKTQIFDRLVYAEGLERFLANKFSTAKRFGLEGCETLIPGLKALIDRGTELGLKDLVIGMPHRGRLNTLVNVVRKPAEMLFKEFHESHVDAEAVMNSTDGWTGSGDVKYHLGTSFTRAYPDGRTINLSLVANPSHLEAVNPVVCGKVRAKQDIERKQNGTEPTAAMGLLMHGDAAFAGQGVVYETMNLAQLNGYGTAGTVHVIVNNQVGFTTDPCDGRSTLYSSDLGKAFGVPIFHVNADDPEAVTRAFEIAVDWRMQFKEDVIIDLIGYRKLGHNEIDQPAFTQPLQYQRIDELPSSRELYRQRLVEEGSLTAEEVDGIENAAWHSFETAYENSKSYAHKVEWLSSRWSGFFTPREWSKPQVTGVNRAELEECASRLVALPDGFTLHTSLNRIMDAKRKALQSGEGIDWGTAEALAFATLAREGDAVRLSGQDCQRGTFSHRHAVLHDQKTDERFVPLHNLGEAAATVEVVNSSLSEFGVMGFELGYSIESPNQLVLWEAQFGDFSNGAQVIIDQFLSSGEAKWHRQCGLTLLLPHGYDGQGPEHSSCRIERFLQMCDEPEDSVPPVSNDESLAIQRTNMQVVNATTPANYFHVLRRQQRRNFRKPLVIPTPKLLLRHKEAVSSFDDMAGDAVFKATIPDDGAVVTDPEAVRRVVLCSGKLYYDLAAARREKGVSDVAIARVEQLAPFPFGEVAEIIGSYPEAAEVVWAQEEPRNMGYWTHVAPRIETATKHFLGRPVRPRYIGRVSAASPAAGFGRVHKAEQSLIVESTFARE